VKENAKGEIRTKTLTIIYLRAKVINRAKELNDIIPEISPSRVNILKSSERELFKIFIILTNERGLLNISSPKSQIKELI
jgi:uncharacterized pyridoxamine 5'-phosphate oxidase family protein